MIIHIEIINKYHQGIFSEGTKGIISGYVRGGNDIPLAVVVANNVFDLVPFHCLKVLEIEKNENKSN